MVYVTNMHSIYLVTGIIIIILYDLPISNNVTLPVAILTKWCYNGLDNFDKEFENRENVKKAKDIKNIEPQHKTHTEY